MKRIISVMLALTLALTVLVAPGAMAESATGGKILFMANTSSGAVYDFNVAYMDMWMSELGYDWEMIYGDSANDPAGNLAAVQNAMTSDVVALIACQDGGIGDIMAEYPEIYVVGYLNDMASVYSEGGASAACKDNDHFLGTVASGLANGEDIGKMYAQQVIDAGYKKIAICMSPAFAYPQYAIADATIRAEIEAYNATVGDDEKIEVVGDSATVLMFSPIPDSFFNEPENQDLDAIVGLCGGQIFCYPPMLTAISNGLANPDMKLLTSGFENDPDMMADVGTGIVQVLNVNNFESLLYCIVMLDNALQGNQFADFTAPEVLDAAMLKITNVEIMTNIVNNSAQADADMSKLAVSLEDGKQYFTRYTENATYEGLKDLLSSDQLTEAGYAE